MDMSVLDALWVLVCTGFVFLMQAGFLCLETGLTRSKNAVNVALKNVADFALSFLLYWAFGFAVMFGVSRAGWIGSSGSLMPMDQQDFGLTTMFLFQAMFCATAATIVSGAVSGRMRFGAYLVTAAIVSGMIYPVFGHWAWGGAIGGPAGWLAAIGFVDFAGSSVVHGVGGWAALAAVLVVGPRAGRFERGQSHDALSGSSLPLAMLGTMLLWVGWIGFNGGSTLAMNDQVRGSSSTPSCRALPGC
jgi:Amt family ammonium transporter